MSDAYRNIADVIDRIQSRDVAVTEVKHHTDAKSRGMVAFELTVKVPETERIDSYD